MGMSQISHRCDVLNYSFSQKPDLNTSPTRENRKSLESENEKYLYHHTEALKETYGIELKPHPVEISPDYSPRQTPLFF